MSDFDKAFELVVAQEGGYSNDPRDSGGETKWGISKQAYPTVDVYNLTLQEAKELYRSDFWMKVHGDQIPYPLNVFVFDSAVNQGVVPAIKMLQKAIGVAQDGILGRDTLGALGRKFGGEVMALYMAERVMRYTGTRSFDVFGRGWIKRLFKITMEV